MNINDIRELADIMSKHSLTELEVDDNNMKVRLFRNTQIVEAMPIVKEEIKVIEKTEAVKETLSGDKLIKSPTVGIFYSSASPDSDPYVSVGSQIKNGDTVCIIEAMKLMNEIQADADGEIVEVLVGNGQVVEYDQPLFRVR